MLCAYSDLCLRVSVLGEQSRLGILAHPEQLQAFLLLGTELQDEAQFWVLSSWHLARSHVSWFCLSFVHCFRVFSGGFQPRFLKLWLEDLREAFQDARWAGRLSECWPLWQAFWRRWLSCSLISLCPINCWVNYLGKPNFARWWEIWAPRCSSPTDS